MPSPAVSVTFSGTRPARYALSWPTSTKPSALAPNSTPYVSAGTSKTSCRTNDELPMYANIPPNPSPIASE